MNVLLPWADQWSNKVCAVHKSFFISSSKYSKTRRSHAINERRTMKATWEVRLSHNWMHHFLELQGRSIEHCKPWWIETKSTQMKILQNSTLHSPVATTLMTTNTYSRKCKEGHPDHTECGSQQASIPGLGNLITIADGSESDLVKG